MGQAQSKMTVRWRLRNPPETIPVVMAAKYVPGMTRQRCHWNYCNIFCDKGFSPLGVPNFVLLADNL